MQDHKVDGTNVLAICSKAAKHFMTLEATQCGLASAAAVKSRIGICRCSCLFVFEYI